MLVGIFTYAVGLAALRTGTSAVATEFTLAARIAALDWSRALHGLACRSRTIEHHCCHVGGGHVGSHVGDGCRAVWQLSWW